MLKECILYYYNLVDFLFENEINSIVKHEKKYNPHEMELALKARSRGTGSCQITYKNERTQEFVDQIPEKWQPQCDPPQGIFHNTEVFIPVYRREDVPPSIIYAAAQY